MQQIWIDPSDKTIRKTRPIRRYTHPKDDHIDAGSALWIAVRNNDLPIVSLLIDYQCDVNDRNNKGETPIMYAVKNNNLLLVALLMRGPIYYNETYKKRIENGLSRRNPKRDNYGKQKAKRQKLNDGSAADVQNKNTKFVPVDLTLKDNEGHTAIHHSVITDGLWKPSYENNIMMELLINESHPNSDLLLQNFKVPYLNSLKEEELKLVKITKFSNIQRSSLSKMDIITCVDNAGKNALFYAALQKSEIMKDCLLKLIKNNTNDNNYIKIDKNGVEEWLKEKKQKDEEKNTK